MASNMAGKDSSEKNVLLEFEGLKKVCAVTGEDNKVSLIERVFKTRLSSAPTTVVSLQRFDPEWEDLVDIEVDQIRDRDKIKVLIIDNGRESAPCSAGGLKTGQERDVPEHGVEQLISNLEEERKALDYKFSIAKATLESLKVAPKDRGLAGKHSNFTCSSCHYKGHRVNSCMLHPCRGYFECGQLSLHREHRDNLKEAEAEVKETQKQIKRNMDEIENYKHLKQRTRTNFFALTRKKLQCCNPIKYSNRVQLDNDLRILATACKHRVPSDTADLEQIIEDYRNKANNRKPMSYEIPYGGRGHDVLQNGHQRAPFTMMSHPPPVYGSQGPRPYMTPPVYGSMNPRPNMTPPFYGSTSPRPNMTPPFYGRTSPRPNMTPPFYGSTSPRPNMTPPFYGSTSPRPNMTPPFYGSMSPRPYVNHGTPSQCGTTVWDSPPGNVNNRWQNFSVGNRSPHYYPSRRGGFHQKPQNTHFSQSTYERKNVQSSESRQCNYDHVPKKKLKYGKKDRGKQYRESLKFTSNSATATCTKIGSDDETQDDSLTESPTPKSSTPKSSSTAGAQASSASVENADKSQILYEESQSFNFESWEKEQFAAARNVSTTP